MAKDIHTTVKEINRGKNLKENLPVYADMMKKAYITTAALHFSMNYETMFEQLLGQGENVPEDIKDIFIKIKGYLEKILEDDIGNVKEKLLIHRRDITGKMEILTSCVDRLLNTEYVHNRMEYKFLKASEDIPSVEEITGDVMRFLFINKDTAITNERIREVLGQLPVRMAKSRFYDILKNGLGLYKGGDKESFEGILYIIRTGAGLYHTEAGGNHFLDIQDRIGKIENSDYDNMSEDDYKNVGEEIKDISGKLNLFSDLYVEIQTLINELLSLSMLGEGSENLIPEKIYKLLKSEAELLSLEECEKESALKAVTTIEEMFIGLEGLQEENMERQNLLEAVLEEAADFSKNDEMLNRLLTTQRLLGNSQFAEIENIEASEIISDEEFKRKISELLNDFEDSFKNHKQRLNRAVMANVLSSLPVFFHTPEEVREYVEDSLSQCRDESERKISIELLQKICE